MVQFLFQIIFKIMLVRSGNGNSFIGNMVDGQGIPFSCFFKGRDMSNIYEIGSVDPYNITAQDFPLKFF